MKRYLAVILVSCFVLSVSAAPPNKYNLMIAPGTLSETSVTLLWDKQYGGDSLMYHIIVNGKTHGFTGKTNYTLDKLKPATTYKVSFQLITGKNSQTKKQTVLKFKTAAQGKVYNILDFGAKSDSTFINTSFIQKAIDACTAGGTVYIPKGTFLSGALFLKSNMTLHVAEGAVLQGSVDTLDYLPLIKNRFEGWEMYTYASLINAGTLNRDGSYNVRNLRITGGGTIKGGGKKLELACKAARGIRSRGRLILLMNSQDVSIDNLTITEPPCWTIHYLYSDNISCHNLTIITKGIHNGDGIDPDSSTDSYIFNCTFDTGDDCIAIKSGKNPEGYYVGKPTTNVRITNCNFIRGHGISIGSEMSGGVSGVLVQDCKAGALLHGMQIKGTKDRGGYVKNVTVDNCQLMKITIFSAVNYNNDGEAAPVLPTFENFVFKNIDLSQANVKEPVININGFTDPKHKLRNVVFTNLTLPENGKVVINDAEKVKFEKVKTVNGQKPEYVVKSSTGIVY
ncbi:glycosyl hydrolase family 28 protein [Lacibacter sediminis]|uniref:Glycoside hydrolase family 28 protein n=1 Tax=Lacibacter sediminis TaxID=2760713 RepID=A0A7G5XB27_9BACT|nr:glycosyl hydrolase family 28 protein [Lacibacter sediminis]QNA42680.1 glycoside hydrolase family 28 protein [Lacibacter sediminis]